MIGALGATLPNSGSRGYKQTKRRKAAHTEMRYFCNLRVKPCITVCGKGLLCVKSLKQHVFSANQLFLLPQSKGIVWKLLQFTTAKSILRPIQARKNQNNTGIKLRTKFQRLFLICWWCEQFKVGNHLNFSFRLHYLFELWGEVVDPKMAFSALLRR